MNILVTGGAGYVGSHCLGILLDAGHHVVVYDNLSKGHRRAVDQRAKLIVADLTDTARLRQTFADGGFEAVMHFAALAEVGESVREPLLYYGNNLTGTVSLLGAMKEHGVRRLVFSSTCATYGVPPAVPITEEMPLDPISPYGRTKLAIEWVLRDCALAWGLGATALRYFNAAGAAADSRIGEDHDPETHLIPLVLKVALGQRENIKIFGVDYPTTDGTCVRDYIHVADLAVVHRIALESQPEAALRCYNVGTGRGVSVTEVIDACREVTGREIPAIPSPRREGDPPELYADPTKIVRELGWKAEYTDIGRTVATAWAWHRRNPEGFGAA